MDILSMQVYFISLLRHEDVIVIFWLVCMYSYLYIYIIIYIRVRVVFICQY